MNSHPLRSRKPRASLARLSLLRPAMNARQTASWIEHYARIGFAAKGIVYLILGSLALGAAIGTGGRITGIEGAVGELLAEPHGRLLVAALAVGLGGYALWRFLEAFADADRKGTRPASWVVRVGYACSGAIYAALAWDAARLALHGGVRHHRWSLPAVLDSRLGTVLVVLLALGLSVYAVYEFVRALRGRVDDELQLSAAPRGTAPWLATIVTFGTGARALVFAFLGVLLLRTAATPAAAAAVDATAGMRFAARLPNGRWWLAFVAAGFAAYGLEQIFQALYRRVRLPA